MRRIVVLSFFVALLIGASRSAWAQDQNSLAAIRDALTAKYALTTTTADKTDIVTAGAVLVLKKSNLLTVDVTKGINYPNTYRNGRITQNFFGQIAKSGGSDTRTFVSGEKLWVTDIQIKEKGVVFTLFTDAYSDVRYQGTLTFPFAKGATPSMAEVSAVVSQVFDIQPSDDAKTNQQAPAGGQQSAPANAASPASPQTSEAAPPAIAPPPPPPADPKTISLGQTPDQVTAALGQPGKIVKLGAKQIYYYKDMKVIFVNGKVTDVQ